MVKILNTWEVSSDEVLASQEVHDISVAIGMDPDSDDLKPILRYGKIYVSLRMRTPMVLPYRHFALCFICSSFPGISKARSCLYGYATSLSYRFR